MPDPDGARRSTVRLLLVGLLTCALAGCGSSASDPGGFGNSAGATPSQVAGSSAPSASAGSADRTAGPATPVSRPQSVDALLSAIADAVNRRDRSEFESLLSAKDPGFADTADMIFDNLRAIQPQHFSLRATGNRRTPTASRASVLGTKAYAIEVDVRWAVPGDRSASDQRVWMTVLPSKTGIRWAGVADAPKRPQSTPLWWLEPVNYAHSGPVTVIAGSQNDIGTWMSAARTAVSKDAPKLRQSGWNRKLVIIVPDNEKLMEESIGDAVGTDAALAAITWPDGTKAATAPVRIMINPSGQQGGLATAIVLAHETVHVATRSPTSPAPSWLIEGFADHIAYRDYPQGVQSAAADLLAEVKRHGPPADLPDESDFAVEHQDLNRSYAEAWLACRYLSDRYGSAKFWQFYQAVGRSPDGSISGPARSAFGISQDQLVSGWQTYLQSAAKRGRI